MTKKPFYDAFSFGIYLRELNYADDKTGVLDVFKKYKTQIKEMSFSIGDLVLILPNIPAKYKTDFLELAKDGVKNAIKTEMELATILAELEDDASRIAFMSAIGSEKIRKTIRTAAGFAILLDWVDYDAERRLIDMIGPDEIRRLIRTPEHFSEAIFYVSEDNKDYLSGFILDSITEQVFDASDLFLLIQGATDGMISEIVSRIGLDKIRKLVKDDETLSHGLSSISERREKVFLQELKKLKNEKE